MTYRDSARKVARRVRNISTAGLLAVLVAVAVALGYQSLATSPSTVASPIDIVPRAHHGPQGRASGGLPDVAVSSVVWPAHGQAAVVLTGESQVHAGPNQHVAPIASVAKVMTAYLVLRDHPLQIGEDGPSITLTEADVADTERRRAQQESVVAIATGEQLTERQALQALLLPSANNIAAVLARWDARSIEAFVDRMNATARSLGMTHTRYTDPSGYDDATVSTAADQVRIVQAAMSLPVRSRIHGRRCAGRPHRRPARCTRCTAPNIAGAVGAREPEIAASCANNPLSTQSAQRRRHP